VSIHTVPLQSPFVPWAAAADAFLFSCIALTIPYIVEIILMSQIFNPWPAIIVCEKGINVKKSHGNFPWDKNV
jgi:hypothetical protein